jgi:Dynamin GTPase effector domain
LLNSCSCAILQVKQSQEHLLERLISYVHNLEPTQLEHLLEEDQEVTQKRAAAQMSLQVGSDC